MTVSMFLLMFGHGFSQNLSGNDDEKQKSKQITNMTSDKSSTLTHTAPFNAFDTKILPKNSKIKISNPEDALYIELQTFTNMSGKDLKCVFSPLVVLKPFIRIKDKFMLSFITTQMVHNYAKPSMIAVTHDMYVHAKLATKYGDCFLKLGNFSALNYSGKFSKRMPVSNYFINASYFNAGHYFPRAVMGGFSNGETTVGIGYAEDNNNGFYFNGDGWVVLCIEEKFEDSFQFGGLLKVNKHKSFGNVHLILTPTYRDNVLLEFLNMGERFAFHGTYSHDLKDNKATIYVNGFVQSDDGIRGGNIGFYHPASGAYVATGAVYRDPLRGEQNDNFSPLLEFGINKGIYPGKTR